MSFFGQLEARARATESLLCVGLDPHAADLKAPTADAARAFCARIIEATLPYAAAYKPNAAFFERFGPEGMAALRSVIACVPPEVPVILDAKRGDISSTAEAYADAAFDALGAGAITLHPYMGDDSVRPFLRSGKGAFVLCRTSNPSAGAIQDAPLADGRRVYEAVADAWANQGNVGFVVGATAPAELAGVRARCPDAWILAPGVGAQGGDLAATVAAGRRDDGYGLLINVSRGISRAADPAAKAKELVQAMRAAQTAPRVTHDPDAVVADGLLRAGCVRFGRFTLKSGLISPIYLDLRRLIGFPDVLRDVGSALARLLTGLDYDVVAALPYAATPLGTAACLQSGDRMVYPRREVKDYGTKAAVEGVFEAGETAVILDDLATTGGSKIEAVAKLADAGLSARDVVVLVDRESGAREQLAAAGLTLHACFTLRGLLRRWEGSGAITSEQADEVRAFLDGAS